MKKLSFFLIPLVLSTNISIGVTHATTPTAPTFQVKNFATCEELEDTLLKVIDRYQDRYWTPYMYYRGGPIMLDSVANTSVEKVATPTASDAGGTSAGGTASVDPFSTTNTQVAGVDEADVVKTDGNYIYTYSQSRGDVSIVRMSDMKLMRSISLPSEYASVEMYVRGTKLILVGQKYLSSGAYYSYRFFAPETKSLVAIYDVTDPTAPKLERYTQIDGNYRDSRLIGDTLYFLSSTSLRVPPYYLSLYADTKGGDVASATTRLRNDFVLKNFVPQIREARATSRLGKYIQSIRASAASCSDISFVLPDDATLAKVDFTPSFISLGSLSFTDANAKMKTQILFGDVSQIHMSQSSLYITSTISQTESTPAKCPMNAKCIAPSYQYESSTLIHRYALENGTPKYVYTTKVAGNPMNQYSMDEDANGNFRLVTQSYAWSSGQNQNSTNLSIIDKTGKLIGSLSGIAPGENFQSARFIGDRLYLVTFEQIDPLFVIDLSSPTAPKVLGELKMPGYSTYLHPYDNDRLIGIGYDTVTNKWGGTQNGGLKIDLYNVSDVKNPKQEASLTLGDQGSSSEVLSNPRAFVYYKEKNLLLLPAQISYSAKDASDPYRVKSIYQGLIGVSILPTVIKESFRMTHILPTGDIEKEWKKDCEQYTPKTTPVCYKLINGAEYCKSDYTYVPSYCYADATVESYLAANIWNYSTDYITRALYKGNTVYSLSDSAVKSWSLSAPTAPVASVSFSGVTKEYRYPVLPVMMK